LGRKDGTTHGGYVRPRKRCCGLDVFLLAFTMYGVFGAQLRQHLFPPVALARPESPPAPGRSVVDELRTSPPPHKHGCPAARAPTPRAHAGRRRICLVPVPPRAEPGAWPAASGRGPGGDGGRRRGPTVRGMPDAGVVGVVVVVVAAHRRGGCASRPRSGRSAGAAFRGGSRPIGLAIGPGPVLRLTEPPQQTTEPHQSCNYR
jgi:hypothetical protein